jgi:hypothetical protein
LADEEEIRRVNPFDWQQAFPEVFAAGGFNAVIGNPPWGANIDLDLKYFHEKYPKSTRNHTDSFKIFIEQGLNQLRDSGLFSLIIPNTLLEQERLMDVRELLLKNMLMNVVNLGENVFKNVIAPSCIFVVKKASNYPVEIQYLDLSRYEDKEHILHDPINILQKVSSEIFQTNHAYLFKVIKTIQNQKIVHLGEYTNLVLKDAGINYQRVNVGMQVKGESDLSNRLLYEGTQQDPRDQMYWKGVDINRYWISEETNRFCRTDVRLRTNEVVHLNKDIFSIHPKILIRQTADEIIACLDNRGIWFGRSIISIILSKDDPHSIEYFLALLNSNLITQKYREIVNEEGRAFAQVKLGKVRLLPLRLIDFKDPEEVAYHNKIVEHVRQIIGLNAQTTLLPFEKSNRNNLKNHLLMSIQEIINVLYLQPT